MSEPNQYDPPREMEPLTKGQVVKRGIGVGIILLLTPLAVGIATLVSCGAVYAIVPRLEEDLSTAFIIGWTVFLSPPIVTFVAMICWMISQGRRNRQARDAAAIAAFWEDQDKKTEHGRSQPSSRR